MGFTKMKYPKTLKIGDRTYRIKFVKSIRGCRRQVGKGATIGIADPRRIEVLIKKGLSKDLTLKTFFHEIIHCIEYEYDIKISHPDVDKFEEAIFDLMCANLPMDDE